MTYNASSIKILSPEESGLFDWKRSEEIAKQYHQPTDFIKRGFEASRMSGLDPELFIARYVHGDKSIVMPVEFVEIFRELANQQMDTIPKERDTQAL